MTNLVGLDRHAIATAMAVLCALTSACERVTIPERYKSKIANNICKIRVDSIQYQARLRGIIVLANAPENQRLFYHTNEKHAKLADRKNTWLLIADDSFLDRAEIIQQNDKSDLIKKMERVNLRGTFAGWVLVGRFDCGYGDVFHHSLLIDKLVKVESLMDPGATFVWEPTQTD